MTTTVQTVPPKFITASQRMFIADLLKKAPAEVKAPIYAKGLDGMTMAEASALIDTLKGKRASKPSSYTADWKSGREHYGDNWHKGFKGVCD